MFAWLVAIIVIGLLIALVFEIPRHLAIPLVALALAVNGWVAWREDRGSFND